MFIDWRTLADKLGSLPIQSWKFIKSPQKFQYCCELPTGDFVVLDVDPDKSISVEVSAPPAKTALRSNDAAFFTLCRHDFDYPTQDPESVAYAFGILYDALHGRAEEYNKKLLSEKSQEAEQRFKDWLSPP